MPHYNLTAEVERQHDLIKALEQKEEVLLSRLSAYESMFGYDSPGKESRGGQSEVEDKEALSDVEYELEKALASYYDDQSKEDDVRVSRLVNELLGCGELQKALGGGQVSYTRATRIAKKLLAYYKQNSPPSTTSRILEILAQEGLSQRIANPRMSPWDDEPFSWWAERPNTDEPGSLTNRLTEINRRCHELARMLDKA